MKRDGKCLINALNRFPQAFAEIKGSEKYRPLHGEIRFYQTETGVMVYAELNNLPTEYGRCSKRVFGFHIHEGESCGGRSDDAFKNTGGHYNPYNCPHPSHSGDLLPLEGNNGYAFEVFLTDRFSAEEIIGKTVIVHLNPDDFTTQPSGNSGEKIACGEIQRYYPKNKYNCSARR